MNQIRIGSTCLLVLLLAFSKSGYSQQRRQNTLKTLAILDLKSPTAAPWLGTAVSEALRVKLAGVEGLRLVEREKIDLICGARCMTPLPKLFGADFLLAGSLQLLDDEPKTQKIRISAGILCAASAKLKGDLSLVVNGDRADLFALETELAQRLADKLGKALSAKQAGYREVRNQTAEELCAQGLLKLQIAQGTKDDHKATLLREAIQLLRQAQNENEGLFYGGAHNGETRAREALAACQKDAKAAAQIRQQTVDQFRQDAANAAPAFLNLGRALEANAQWQEAISAYGQYVTWMSDQNRVYVRTIDLVDSSTRREEAAVPGLKMTYYRILKDGDSIYVLTYRELLALSKDDYKTLWSYRTSESRRLMSFGASGSGTIALLTDEGKILILDTKARKIVREFPIIKALSSFPYEKWNKYDYESGIYIERIFFDSDLKDMVLVLTVKNRIDQGNGRSSPRSYKIFVTLDLQSTDLKPTIKESPEWTTHAQQYFYTKYAIMFGNKGRAGPKAIFIRPGFSPSELTCEDKINLYQVDEFSAQESANNFVVMGNSFNGKEWHIADLNNVKIFKTRNLTKYLTPKNANTFTYIKSRMTQIKLYKYPRQLLWQSTWTHQFAKQILYDAAHIFVVKESRNNWQFVVINPTVAHRLSDRQARRGIARSQGKLEDWSGAQKTYQKLLTQDSSDMAVYLDQQKSFAPVPGSEKFQADALLAGLTYSTTCPLDQRLAAENQLNNLMGLRLFLKGTPQHLNPSKGQLIKILPESYFIKCGFKAYLMRRDNLKIIRSFNNSDLTLGKDKFFWIRYYNSFGEYDPLLGKLLWKCFIPKTCNAFHLTSSYNFTDGLRTIRFPRRIDLSRKRVHYSYSPPQCYLDHGVLQQQNTKIVCLGPKETRWKRECLEPNSAVLNYIVDGQSAFLLTVTKMMPSRSTLLHLNTLTGELVWKTEIDTTANPVLPNSAILVMGNTCVAIIFKNQKIQIINRKTAGISWEIIKPSGKYFDYVKTLGHAIQLDKNKWLDLDDGQLKPDSADYKAGIIKRLGPAIQVNGRSLQLYLANTPARYIANLPLRAISVLDLNSGLSSHANFTDWTTVDALYDEDFQRIILIGRQGVLFLDHRILATFILKEPGQVFKELGRKKRTAAFRQTTRKTR